MQKKMIETPGAKIRTNFGKSNHPNGEWEVMMLMSHGAIT